VRCTVITDDLKTTTENTFIRCHPGYRGVVCPVTYAFPVGMIPQKVIAALRIACSGQLLLGTSGGPFVVGSFYRLENTFIRCHPGCRGVVCPVTYAFPVGMIPQKVIAALRIACSVWAASPRSIRVAIRGKHVLSPLQRYVAPPEIRCPCNVIVAGVTPARCGHSGRRQVSNSPVLRVGGGFVGLTAVATRAHELFWTRVCR